MADNAGNLYNGTLSCTATYIVAPDTTPPTLAAGAITINAPGTAMNGTNTLNGTYNLALNENIQALSTGSLPAAISASDVTFFDITGGSNSDSPTDVAPATVTFTVSGSNLVMTVTNIGNTGMFVAGDTLTFDIVFAAGANNVEDLAGNEFAGGTVTITITAQ